MKGKSAGRLLSVIAKFEADPNSLRSAERRQLRKLLAQEEGMGRSWKLRGNQKRKKHAHAAQVQPGGPQEDM